MAMVCYIKRYLNILVSFSALYTGGVRGVFIDFLRFLGLYLPL